MGVAGFPKWERVAAPWKFGATYSGIIQELDKTQNVVSLCAVIELNKNTVETFLLYVGEKRPETMTWTNSPGATPAEEDSPMRPTVTLFITLIITALFSLGTSALAQPGPDMPRDAEDSDILTTADGKPYTLRVDGEFVKKVACFGETYQQFGTQHRPQLVDPPAYCSKTTGEIGFSFGLVASPNALPEWSPEVGILWWATDRFGVGGDCHSRLAEAVVAAPGEGAD